MKRHVCDSRHWTFKNEMTFYQFYKQTNIYIILQKPKFLLSPKISENLLVSVRKWRKLHKISMFLSAKAMSKYTTYVCLYVWRLDEIRRRKKPTTYQVTRLINKIKKNAANLPLNKGNLNSVVLVFSLTHSQFLLLFRVVEEKKKSSRILT